MTICEISHISN